MKKDLSHFLLVSDIDGTLNNKLRKTPRVNLEAINRFCEAGGHFTLASARCAESLYTYYKNLPDKSTPAIVLNGAGIYDFSRDKMLWYNAIPESSKAIIKKAIDEFPSLELAIFTEKSIYLVRPRISSRFMMSLDSLEHTECKALDGVPEDNWGKVIFFCMPWNKEKIKRFMLSQKGEGVRYIDTSFASFDLVNETTHKGTAITVLADMLGIKTENIGAIGDYFNDYDMLRSVAHPACPSQAPEEIKALCEFHACHCNNGAVADFINYIENNY